MIYNYYNRKKGNVLLENFILAITLSVILTACFVYNMTVFADAYVEKQERIMSQLNEV